MKKLILASGSPRRKELLKELGYKFEIIPSNIDEKINVNNNIQEEIEKLSYKKAYSVFKDNVDSIVIGADTIVVKDNAIYGKPKDKKEAFQMLKNLSNNEHSVITGVSILSNKMSETFSSITTVKFGELSDEEILNYIDNENVLDKAGAYAIQGGAKKFIKSINGEYYTIVGLPIHELYKRIKKYYE